MKNKFLLPISVLFLILSTYSFSAMTYKERKVLEKQWYTAAENRDRKTVMAIMKKFIKEYPNEAYLYEYLGTSYAEENDYKQSEQYLLKAIELGDKDTALITLSFIYEEQEDTKKAEETRKKIDEKFLSLPMDVARIIRHQKMLAVFLDDFYAQWYLADFYLTHLENNKEASKWAKKALENSKRMSKSERRKYAEELKQIEEILK